MDAPHRSTSLPVNEIRDYHRINAELAQQLDRGATRIRLTGVEGQRLLLSSLRGNWNATIELDGRAGPELASELDAPNLTILAHAGAADGAGRGLRSGSLFLLGETGNLVAYRQTGGAIYCLAPVGHRPGLELRGGSLLLASYSGRLIGERQCGGRIFVGPLAASGSSTPGHARRGGRCLLAASPLSPDDKHVLDHLLQHASLRLGRVAASNALNAFGPVGSETPPQAPSDQSYPPGEV